MPSNPNSPYIELSCSKCGKIVESEIEFLSPQQFVKLNGSIMKCTNCDFTYVNASIHKHVRRPFKLSQSDIALIESKEYEKFKDRVSLYHRSFLKKRSLFLFTPKKKYNIDLINSQPSLDDYMENKTELLK